jgi:hypothetical protein
MADDRPKTSGFYVTYLEKLHRQREADGLPPAPDIADSEYWETRRRNEELKQLPLPKAA